MLHGEEFGGVDVALDGMGIWGRGRQGCGTGRDAGPLGRDGEPLGRDAGPLGGMQDHGRCCVVKDLWVLQGCSP